MKKLFSLLAAGVIVSFLAACNNTQTEINTDDVNPDLVNEVVNEPNEKVDEKETSSTEEFKRWLEGEGPYTAVTSVTTFTIPEGMKYEVNSAYIADDGKFATVELGLTPIGAYQFGSLTVTNQWMVKSYEGAVEHTIKLQNLATYKEGKSELLDEVEYNGIKYQTIKTSTEYWTDYFLAGYQGGREIMLKMPEKKGWFAIDDAKIKELMGSLSVVPLQ